MKLRTYLHFIHNEAEGTYLHFTHNEGKYPHFSPIKHFIGPTVDKFFLTKNHDKLDNFKEEKKSVIKSTYARMVDRKI